jgi:glycosyltransferase involved in cell wall biosynthesis
VTAPRLVLDMQGCQDVRNGDRGIGRYVAGAAAALCRRDGAVAAMLLNPQLPVPGHLANEILDSPLLGWNTAAAVDAAAAGGPIAYHLLSPFETGTPGPIAVPTHAVGEGAALVATLYDLIPLHDPDRHLPGQALRRYHQRLELLRSCDLLLCISEHTRRDAVASLGVDPRRCVTVGGGADARFRPATPGDDAMSAVRRALPPVRRRVVLAVTGGVERKNTERLISAYARLPRAVRAEHQLVVACELAPTVAALWSARVAAERLDGDEVVFTGFVDDDTLLALYQAATLVVMPSLDEGYGLPIAEAIACDTPVITSNTSALPEILEMPESTFDPRDVDNMARVLERGLIDDAFRLRLREAGRRAAPHNTWDAVAARTLAALELLGQPAVRGARRRERRMRLALVGPVPPVASGVADYNGRVAAALAERADVDVLVPPAMVRPPHGSLPRVLPSTALGERIDPASYDALLYTFGNSEHHLTTYDLAHRFPGVLWLHDIRLGGFHHNYSHQRFADPRPWMRERLRENYAPRLRGLDGIEDLFSRDWQHSRGIFLSRSLVQTSRAVLVNSAFAEQLCRLDQGPDSASPPIVRLPFGIHATPRDDLPRRDTDPPVIISAGSVDPIKAPERIIDALAAIAERTPARLVFLGYAPTVYRGVLEQRAASLGVGERVSFTGATDEAAWWQWLARGTVAVQLRRLTNGETSAATGDAQSSGMPVVTNVVNAALDYPPGTVVAVDERRPGELEGVLLRLLSDRAEWERHSRAALDHARASSFGHVADVLLSRLDDLLSGRLVAGW